MLGRSHCFLGIYQYFGELKVSCSRRLVDWHASDSNSVFKHMFLHNYLFIQLFEATKSMFKSWNSCAVRIWCSLRALHFSVTLLCFTSLPFSNICKKIVNVILVFAQTTSQFHRNQNGRRTRIFIGFQWFFTFFYIDFGYTCISMQSFRKWKNNYNTCLFQCINVSRVSRKQFEPSANINAWKNMHNPYNHKCFILRVSVNTPNSWNYGNCFYPYSRRGDSTCRSGGDFNENLPTINYQGSNLVYDALIVSRPPSVTCKIYILFTCCQYVTSDLGWATLFYCGTPWAFHIIISDHVIFT